jgi:CheY-like chemotaxis protein/HPt (histidine-containing phosphotransfer) domain-containing protein
VLIVEDNVHQRLILQELVRGWRMQPRTVPDADTALEVLRTAVEVGAPYPMVIADGDLPKGGSLRLAEAFHGDPALARTRVLWLTSPRSQTALIGVGERCGRVNKPVIPSPLLEAVQSLLLDEKRDTPASPAHSTLRAARSLHVLVADDNAVNRRVARGLLELAGHRVTCVDDGMAAVDAITATAFDAVLMDVQMPVLDGFDATRIIRDSERDSGGRRLPIFALTAQAMKGDAQRCVEAGMDGYLAKPLDPDAVLNTLAEIANAPAPHRAPERRAGTRDATPFDHAHLLEQVGGSPELVREVIGIFLEDLPGMVTAVEEALTDADGLMRAAHRLKGSLLTVGCVPATACVRVLEDLGRSGHVEGSAQLFTALQAELTRAEQVLRQVARPEAA